MSYIINIKQALIEDLDEIMKIENACFDADAFSRHQITYLITRSKGIFLIARHNGEIAGYLSFIISGRHNTGRIYSVAVSPGHRGEGIASLLMDKTIEHALKSHLRAIFLEVRTDNQAAIQLYKNKNFAMHSIKNNYYNDESHAHSMVLRIL